jgi:lipid II:glycine glycyltransferase (peptidoglycan interpeptide bridge formation enzyme)
MFQKAYAQAVMIQGIDEQIGAMLEQREKLENEIHDMQSQLNDQFERMLEAAKRSRLRLQSQISHPRPQEMQENIKLSVTLPPRHEHEAARAAS